MTHKTLADVVREARERRGMTQEQLDEAIGKSRGYTGMLEIGRVGRPRPEAIRALADVLGVPAGDLLVASGQLQPREHDEEIVTLLMRLDSLPDREARRAAFRQLPEPIQRAIQALMADLFAEAGERLRG